MVILGISVREGRTRALLNINVHAVYIPIGKTRDHSGLIRSSQESLVPSQIPVVERQLRIPVEYLQAVASTVKSAVKEIDDYVKRSWPEVDASQLSLKETGNE